jgi:SAM-dependent methyltransferase
MIKRLRQAVSIRAERGLRAIANRFLRPYAIPVQMPTRCVRCGYDRAILIDTPVKPDFQVQNLDLELRGPFQRHRDGVCANCGLYQAYERFDASQLERINGIGKDALTTDEVYQGYPIPAAYIDAWYGSSMERLVPRWRQSFAELGLRPRKALFLRHWFGRAMAFVHDEWGADIYGVELSSSCRRYVAEHYPFVHQLEGSINGNLAGPFLASGSYDAIFVQHVLVHSNDVVNSIRQLRQILAPDGFLHLGAESKVAPTNPFHKFYPSEFQLFSLLRDEFAYVHKLDEHGIIRQSDPRMYSGQCVEWIATNRSP